MHQINHTTSNSTHRWMILAVLLLAPAVVHAQVVSIDETTRQRALAYESLFITAADQHGINARLLWVIAYLESRFRPQAVSPKGARGLMQLMPGTAVRWGVRNPHEPGPAITGAARYVQYLGHRFDGRVDLTLAAYNAGETAVEAYRTGRSVRAGNKLINPFRLRTDGVPPYRETRAYVRTGIALLQRFSAYHAMTALPRQSNAQTVPSLESEVIIPAATIRKSISYAVDTVSSVSSPPPVTTPRSISYQSR